jgi:quercetin dioxygenase-like cupin family protein
MTTIDLKGKILKLEELINYQEGSIVSREILRLDTGTITLFAFDAGQGLSEHTAPFDATVYIIEGVAEIKIDKDAHILTSGDMIIMPANIPHAVYAKERFKMLLIMLKK